MAIGWLSVVALLVACDGTQGATDAMTYPAVAIHLPQVTGSGVVMANVHVIPVFVPGDPNRDRVVAFLGKLAASPEWSMMVGEYGVGALSVGSPIELTSPLPTTVTNVEIATFMQQQVATHWAPFSPANVYALFLPITTRVTNMGLASCTGGAGGGYHAWTTAPAATGSIPFIVVQDCGAQPPLPITMGLAHEVVETATDPTYQGFGDVAAADIAWAAFGAEVADMCEGLETSAYLPPGFSDPLQRSWSNAAAAAGQDPCVPHLEDAGPYFGGTIDTPDTVTFLTKATPGIRIKSGETRTVDVHLFSMAETSGPWTVRTLSNNPAVQLSLDRSSGTNGDVLKLSIHAQSSAAAVASIRVVSTLEGYDTQWPAVVEVTP